MTREDILRMAERAGINVDTYGDIWGSTDDGLLRFATLVAAAERKQCHALLLKIKRKCEDSDRMWQVEDFIDEVICARGGE